MEPEPEYARHIIHLYPTIGAGTLRFGMSVAETQRSLEVSWEKVIDFGWGCIWACMDMAIQLEFNDDQLEIIRVHSNPRLEPLLYGQAVFDCSAKELFAKIATEEGDPTLPYADTYRFPKQHIGVTDSDSAYDTYATGSADRRAVFRCLTLHRPPAYSL